MAQVRRGLAAAIIPVEGPCCSCELTWCGVLQLGHPYIDMLKIDTEGGEFEDILGAPDPRDILTTFSQHGLPSKSWP